MVTAKRSKSHFPALLELKGRQGWKLLYRETHSPLGDSERIHSSLQMLVTLPNEVKIDFLHYLNWKGDQDGNCYTEKHISPWEMVKESTEVYKCWYLCQIK